MDQILVIGSDSLAGHYISQHLSRRHSVKAADLNGPDARRMCSASLKRHVNGNSTIVFCGGGARSSWDQSFGSFQAEARWLNQCIDAAQKNAARLVMLSSDAVFTGPQLFHDDDSRCFSSHPTNTRLQDIESTVADLPNSLIIRTNVVDWNLDETAICHQVLTSLRARRKVRVDATTFSTPITAEAFGTTFAAVLESGVSGFVNIGGAERTTAYHFAHSLATHHGIDTASLVPLATQQPQERSLRCHRLRAEIGVTTPLLRETIESIQIPSNKSHPVAA